MLTIYKASAGSGKTFTLTYEYIKLLLGVKIENAPNYRLNSKKYLGAEPQAARHRRILAITFTNKATEEMKTRIIKELSDLASDDNSKANYTELLVKEFGCTTDELRDAAATALRSLLFDYHHFNVSTIDSFFQTVLRAFARDVDRQGDYGIEIDDEFAVASGVSMMLDDLNYGNPKRRNDMLRWIRNYTMERIEDGHDSGLFNRSGSILRGLSSYIKQMSSEVFKKKADEVIDYLNDPNRIQGFAAALNARKKAVLATQQKGAQDIIVELNALGFDRQILSSNVWNILNAAIEGKIADYNQFNKVKVQQLLNRKSGDNEGYVKKYCPKVKMGLVFPPEGFTEKLSKWLNNQLKSQPEVISLERVRSACASLEFLGFTWDYIKRFRDENNLILLSDTQDLINRIIAGSDAPFIYERIGGALSHFLIDEFQDTSMLQWSNLKPLVANSIATSNDNLIIGDEKQAIYRFRNSDSSLLHHVVAEEDFPADHSIRGNKPSENTNYRSAAGIVKFNNALFSRLARQLGVAGYENVAQGISERNKDLPSYIKIYDTAKAKINDMPAEFEITAREILRQHQAGYRWGDIAVLVRTTKQLNDIVEYLLKTHPEIKVISAEGLLLKNSSAVKLIVGMLKLVDKSYSGTPTADDIPEHLQTYATLNDIRLMISRYDYFRSNGFDPAAALRRALRKPGEEAADISRSIIDVRSARPTDLVSMIEIIIEKLISEDSRRAEMAYIAAFQDEVIKYSKSFNPSIHSFLDWWEEKASKLAISPGEGQDAVNIMTIHKMKGLESSCVIMPFGDISLCKHDENLWVGQECFTFVNEYYRPPLISVKLNMQCERDGSIIKDAAVKNINEQVADNLNVTYVAYTRPTRELIVCFSQKEQIGKEVFEALNASANDNPELYMDLSSYLRTEVGEDCVAFEYGEPTVPVNQKSRAEDNSLKKYEVYYGKYRQSFTKVEDMTTNLGEIMDEVNANPQPATTERHHSEAIAKAAERGTHLHAIMADIATKADIDKAVGRAALRYGFDEEERATISDIIARAFDGAADHIDRWFSPEATVYIEQSIFRPYDQQTFRPDRIVITPDGSVEVVDYKFAAEPTASHKHQVENYMTLLRAMGYNEVKGYLWYPDLNLVESVH